MESNSGLAHRCSTRIRARPEPGDQRLHQSLGVYALQHLDATALEHGEHIEGVELGAGDQQLAEVVVGDLHARQRSIIVHRQHEHVEQAKHTMSF